MKAIVLGSGASGGTPMAGGFWGRCDPEELRNERTRASLYVQSEKTSLLIDTSYDLRQQLNRHKIQKLDGVLMTHEHADHTNGIDDLKAIAYHHEKRIDIFANAKTLSELDRRWPYLFQETSQGIYKGFLMANEIKSYTTVTIGDIEMKTFEQDHYTCLSMGYRFNDFAYSVDVADLDEKALQALDGVETWIVDGGSYMREEPKAHANMQRVMKWVERLKPKMTYITVLSTYMDYKTLCNEWPPHIRPAYDGLEIDF